MFSTLLAASFLIMSDRAELWDAHQIAGNTEEILNDKPIPADFRDFQGQNVLLLVHGFNETAKEVLDDYQTIQNHIQDLNLYDTIIGYLWPGGDEVWEYFTAEQIGDELANRVGTHLQELSDSSAHLDIIAHSLGNRLILEALQSSTPKVEGTLVRNFYSLAAAVKDSSIEKSQPFYLSIKQCDKLFVFHTDKDEVLKIIFLLADEGEALGYEGLDAPNQEPKNVQFIDCTEFVDSHSDYYNALPIYTFIENELNHRIPPLQNGRLLSDGLIEKMD